MTRSRSITITVDDKISDAIDKFSADLGITVQAATRTLIMYGLGELHASQRKSSCKHVRGTINKKHCSKCCEFMPGGD